MLVGGMIGEGERGRMAGVTGFVGSAGFAGRGRRGVRAVRGRTTRMNVAGTESARPVEKQGAVEAIGIDTMGFQPAMIQVEEERASRRSKERKKRGRLTPRDGQSDALPTKDAYLIEIGKTARLDEETTTRLCLEIQDGRMYEAIASELYQELGREPTLDEIQGKTDRNVNELQKAHKNMAANSSLLVESNLKLVLFFSKKYLHSGLSQSDLVQEGSMGLLRAAEKFQPDKGVQFSTYLSIWIQSSMRRALSSKSRMIRMPEGQFLTLMKMRKFVRRYETEHGHSPTHKEIEMALGISAEKLSDLLASAANSKYVSLDVRVTSKSDDLELGDLLHSDKESPDERTTRQLFQEDVKKALSTVLTPRERTVVSMKYGLDGEEKSSKTIAEALSITQQRVSQVEKQALMKLRRHQYLLHDYLFE